MWRTLIRLAPFALVAYKWWQRKQAQKGQAGSARPGRHGPGASGVQDRLP